MKSKRRYLANFEARSVVLVAACVLGGSAAVHAQPSPRTSSGSTTGTGSGGMTLPRSAADAAAADAAFQRADINHDGKLSRAEAQALPALAERFDAIDTDGDGFLSRPEFDKAIQQP